MTAQKISVKCKNCGIETKKAVNRYNESVKNGWNFFCSINCRYAFKTKSEIYSCAWCKAEILKTPGQLRQTINNVFCSKSCAAKYNNRNKKSGSRRSKLEEFLELQIKENYPNFIVLCNSTKSIGLELDFYFPELQLAIEINGFLHFKPIYGLEKLKNVIENDRKKVEKCKNAKIDLKIIDISSEPHLTVELKRKHWETVKYFIETKQSQI